MVQGNVLPPFTEVLRTVWKDCSALWRLFPAYFIFLALQFGALFLSAMVLLVPFFKVLGPNAFGTGDLEEPGFEEMEGILSAFLQWVMDPSRLLLFLGVFFLYSTWWMLLTAVFEGGLFKCFWGRAQEEAPFTLRGFLKDGMLLLGPMILLQFLLFLIVLAGTLVFGLGAGLLTLGLMLGGMAMVWKVLLGLLFGFPLFLGFLGFLLLAFAYSFTAKACLAKGLAPMEALREAFESSRWERWRSMKGILLVFFLYLAVSLPLSLFLNLLSMIPFVGSLFAIFDFLAGVGLAVLFGVFTPGLSVHYLAEAGKKR